MPISLFGNVALPRSKCSACGRTSILIASTDGGWITSCCEMPGKFPRKVKRESACAFGRKLPPLSFRREQLALQDHCCFWCDRPFGSRVILRSRGVTLVVEWDHVIPYSYSLNNAPHNFVGSCQVCNNWKHALMFPTVEETKQHLQIKWAQQLEQDMDPESA